MLIRPDGLLTNWGELLPTLRQSRADWEAVWDRAEEPAQSLPLYDQPLPRRFLKKSQWDHYSGCWLFTGYLNGGYGQIWDGERRTTEQVHRYVYLRLVGPIPEDRPTLDHRCRNAACFYYGHLEPKTIADNARAAAHARKCLATTPLFFGTGEVLNFDPERP